MPQQAPPSARRHYLWSSLLAQRAVREATAARSTGAAAVASVVQVHQITAASRAQAAVAQMLADQRIDTAAEALLNSPAFTTQTQMFESMLEQVATDLAFQQLVSSLVSNAGRAADSVATTVTPDVGYVRYLSPPSCGRCAVLSGRVYRYSTGFLRHPGCDCTMVPTSMSNPAFHHDPADLAKQGLVTGLSKADRRALGDGADFAQVVNIRTRASGLSTPGHVLIRAGRPTPEGIYKAATSRDDAIERLTAAGYVR